MDDKYIWGALTAGILTLVGWIGKHITNSKKHPCKTDVVYKDVCEQKHKGFEDCVESELKNLNCRVTELKTDMKAGLVEIKQMIKNGR